MTTAFGSEGAARVLAAAFLRDRGERYWQIGELELRCSAVLGRARWAVNCENRSRDTARLILLGLLAEDVARDLVAWLDERDAEPLATCGSLAEEHQIGRWQERDELRAKLRKIGVTR